MVDENNPHIIPEISKSRFFRHIQEIATETGMDAYVVGGYVRDLLLQRPCKDIDILIIGDGIEFAKNFASRYRTASKLSVFQNFGTASIHVGDFAFEFVGARKESYNFTSRNPIVTTGSFEDDISRRDFTVNALAISLKKDNSGKLIDLFNGLHDLENQIIKTPLDPDTTFSDDPLRMMRAIRFASQLGFKIHPETFKSIVKNASRISIISRERITDELNKIISSPKPSNGFRLLHDSGLLNIIFPELIALQGTETVDNMSHKDNFYHTLQVLDNVAAVSDNLWLRWAAILHDIGKPATRSFDPETGFSFHAHDAVGSRMVYDIFRNFRLPLNEKLHYVKKLVFLHLRPVALTGKEVTDSAIRRLIVEAGDALKDLLILCRADVTSKNPERVKIIKNRFNIVERKIDEVEEKDRLRNWKNPVTGEMIMKTFGIKPSKEIGMIKEIVKEAILDGEIHNDSEEAYRFMIETGKKMGLTPCNF